VSHTQRNRSFDPAFHDAKLDEESGVADDGVAPGWGRAEAWMLAQSVPLLFAAKRRHVSVNVGFHGT
jgi:hypothetical protein